MEIDIRFRGVNFRSGTGMKSGASDIESIFVEIISIYNSRLVTRLNTFLVRVCNPPILTQKNV